MPSHLIKDFYQEKPKLLSKVLVQQRSEKFKIIKTDTDYGEEIQFAPSTVENDTYEGDPKSLESYMDQSKDRSASMVGSGPYTNAFEN